MKKNKLSLFLFVVLFSALHLSAQNRHVIDSLKKAITTATVDSVRSRQLTLLATAFNSSKPDTAILITKQSLKLAQQSGNVQMIAGAYNELGIANRLVGEYGAALDYFTKATDLYKTDSTSFFRGKILNNIGSVYRDLGNYDKALEAFRKAERIFELAHDTLSIGKAYGNMAAAYFDNSDDKQALYYNEKAYVIFRQLKNRVSMAGLKQNMASIYRHERAFDKALAAARESIAAFRDLKHPSGEAGALESLAGIYFDLGDPDSAMVFFRQALVLREKMGEKKGITNTLVNMADVKVNGHNPDSALYFLDRASAVTAGTHTLYDMDLLYYNYSLAWEQKGNFEKALAYHKRYLAARDSIRNDEKKTELARKEMQFQFDQNRQAELAAQEKHNAEMLEHENRQQLIMYALMAGFLLLLVLTYVIFRGYRNKQKANIEIGLQKQIVEEKNSEITSSITYAKRIQAAVLPDEKILSQSVKDSFLLYRPRDIVSGDFFWFMRKGDMLYVAAADCTGHGVPGALVSVVGINALNQVMEQPGVPGTAEVLGKLHRLVLQALNKDVTQRETKDGMDIAFLRIDLKNRTAEFSGAARPLFYCSAGSESMQQFPGDRSSIAGEKPFDDETPYSTYTLTLTDETTFYMMSDGYVDQFGGSHDKKFLTRRFVDLISSVRKEPMPLQKAKIERAFDDWKGSNEQVDDVLIVGLRV